MEHPITPPPELLQQWAVEYWSSPSKPISASEKHIAIQAARWGADQELEACCKWIDANLGQPPALNLHLFRRPKPPSLKEQALKILADCPSGMTINFSMDPEDISIIRRALQSLPDPQV